MTKSSNLESGRVFTRWTVVSKAEKGNHQHVPYLCRCECGVEKVVDGTSLVSGNSRSCGCLAIDINRKRLRKRPYGVLYNTLVRNAKLTSREVIISYEQFLKFVEIKNCEYCSQEIIWKEFAQNKRSGAPYNLDRKDNDLGYSVENCVVCCGDCNQMKGGRFNHSEFKRIGQLIRQMRMTRKNLYDNGNKQRGYETCMDSNLFWRPVSYTGPTSGRNIDYGCGPRAGSPL